MKDTQLTSLPLPGSSAPDPAPRSGPPFFWKLALLLAAAIWGGSFVVLKDTLDVLTPGWLLGIRFCCTTLLIGIFFRKKLLRHLDRGHLAAGVLLGLASGSAFLVQSYGLMYTSPGKNAFLTAVYCILVPLINWPLLRRRPAAVLLGAAALAVVGVGLLSLESGSGAAVGAGTEAVANAAAGTGEGIGAGTWLSRGDLLSLASAVLFALHIALVPHLARGREISCLTVIQLAVSAVLCLGCALVLEPVPAITTFASGKLWASMAYVVLLASCFCMVVQNVGQTHVESSQAALLLSFESVFAVIASVLFYGEKLTIRAVFGFVCIFAAVVISELFGGSDTSVGGRSPTR